MYESVSILDSESHSSFFRTKNPIFMKRRIRKIVNFFAFNLLFFALYLNFIHKDRANGDIAPAVVSTPGINAATIQELCLFKILRNICVRKKKKRQIKIIS